MEVFFSVIGFWLHTQIRFDVKWIAAGEDPKVLKYVWETFSIELAIKKIILGQKYLLTEMFSDAKKMFT